MNKFLVLLLFAAYVAAVPLESDYKNSVNCFNTNNNKFSCYFVKIISTLRKATLKDCDIIDGVVTFVRNEDVPMEQERSLKSLQQSELEIMRELPQDMSERTIKLMNMMYDAGNSFLNSHTLSLKLSRQSISRALDEGRAKFKKFIWPLIISVIGIKFAVLSPIILSVLSMLAFKAYIVGKIALIFASVVAYDKFFNNSTKVHSDSNVHQNVPSSYDFTTGNRIVTFEHQNPGYRSLDDTEIDGHNLAYSAHAPVPDATK